MVRELKVLSVVLLGVALLARLTPGTPLSSVPGRAGLESASCVFHVDVPPATAPRMVLQAWNGEERLFLLPVSDRESVLEFYDGQRGFRRRVTAAWQNLVLQRLTAMGAGPGFTEFQPSRLPMGTCASDTAIISVSPLGQASKPSRTLTADRKAILFRYLHTEARGACAEGLPVVEAVTKDQIGADVYGFLASFGGR